MSNPVRLSDFIVSKLEELEIDTVFLLSGGGMMHLLDAVGRSKKIATVSQHHEQCCGFAADAYARTRGSLGACFGTSGPGALNLVTAIASAYQDSSPVVFITGQAKLAHTIQNSKIKNLRQFGTFEADIIPIVSNITKFAEMVTDPKKIKYQLEKAIHLATEGRPGPILLDIPLDMQGAIIDPQSLEGFKKPNISSKSFDITSLLQKIRNSERPLIIAGHGVRMSNTTHHLHKFCETLNIPIVTTGMAVDLVPYDHRLLIGHPGVKGDRAGNMAIQNADFILCLGTSMHAMITGYEINKFAPTAYKVLVDPDHAIHERQEVQFDEKIELPLQDFFTAAVRTYANYQAPTYKDWHKHNLMTKNELKVSAEPHKNDGEKLNYYEIINQLNTLSKEGDIFVTDAGLPFYLMGQAFTPKSAQRVIMCGALGQMGYALPATTGAAFAAKQNRVICITGDGSLQTNIHEISVMAYHKLNAKIIVVNNNGYVSIRNTQNNYFNGFLVGTDPEHGVPMANLSKLCESMNMPYSRISGRAELHNSLSKSLNGTSPIVIEIMARPDQEVIPSVTSERTDDGKMISKPIHDMYPFMSPDQLNKYYLNTN